MLSDNHLASWVEVETMAKLAPYQEPVLSPDHVAGRGTCRLSGSYPNLVSRDSPSSDGASVWPGPCPVVMCLSYHQSLHSYLASVIASFCLIPPGLGHSS